MLVALVAALVTQAALMPLSVEELTRLLDGVALQAADPDLVIVEGTQLYLPEGQYIAQGRATGRGSWSASPGRLCHRLHGDRSIEQCISVATDGRGRFYAAESAAAVTEGRAYEIRFMPVLSPR